MTGYGWIKHIQEGVPYYVLIHNLLIKIVQSVWGKHYARMIKFTICKLCKEKLFSCFDYPHSGVFHMEFWKIVLLNDFKTLCKGGLKFEMTFKLFLSHLLGKICFLWKLKKDWKCFFLLMQLLCLELSSIRTVLVFLYHQSLWCLLIYVKPWCRCGCFSRRLTNYHKNGAASLLYLLETLTACHRW